MKIQINKVKITDQEKRKIKLERLKNKRVGIPIGYEWKLTAESKEENESRLIDFHLFCIQIVQQLVTNKFKTNEDGDLRYKNYKFNPYNSRKTNKELQRLFSCIAKDIKKF